MVNGTKNYDHFDAIYQEFINVEKKFPSLGLIFGVIYKGWSFGPNKKSIKPKGEYSLIFQGGGGFLGKLFGGGGNSDVPDFYIKVIIFIFKKSTTFIDFIIFRRILFLSCRNLL